MPTTTESLAKWGKEENKRLATAIVHLIVRSRSQLYDTPGLERWRSNGGSKINSKLLQMVRTAFVEPYEADMPKTASPSRTKQSKQRKAKDQGEDFRKAIERIESGTKPTIELQPKEVLKAALSKKRRKSVARFSSDDDDSGEARATSRKRSFSSPDSLTPPPVEDLLRISSSRA